MLPGQMSWVKFGCYTSDDLIFVSKVNIPNVSLLVSLEVAEKFVVGGWVVVSKPFLVFSLSLHQAEQLQLKLDFASGGCPTCILKYQTSKNFAVECLISR